MMKIRLILQILFPIILIPFGYACSSSSDDKTQMNGSYYTGKYENLFTTLLGKTEEEVIAKVNAAFQQLFYGDNSNERVYYPVEPDMAYIEDVNNEDVRSEGMSYGMMIAVQLNKKNEFDRIWKWAKTFMQHKSGRHENYFSWHCRTDGSIIDSNSASDGEEWFVMSLFFASTRWGDGNGIYNYKAEALKILDAMLNKVEHSDKRGEVTNMFNKKEKQVVFVPSGEADDFTDPSYHVPHFYELWSKLADKENEFWSDVADTSRLFLKKTVNTITGLAPDYANFDGTPTDPYGIGKDQFQFDAWRVAMNVAVDFQWLAKDEWAVEQSNRLLNFFHSLGVNDYGNIYTLDGKKLSNDHSPGLVAMNAVACLASTNNNRKDFINDLWNTSIPTGRYRYYDGMLYILGMLHVSGNYKIYDYK